MFKITPLTNSSSVDAPSSLWGPAAIDKPPTHADRRGAGPRRNMMKTLIAVMALSLSAGAAFAGEANGNPFPFSAPPQV